MIFHFNEISPFYKIHIVKKGFDFLTRLLIKWFVKPYKPCVDIRVKYGILSGVVGIFVNVLLSAIKLIIGVIFGSITVMGDALNNLSDAGSSAVSLIGFKIASAPADEDHPYGHGRVEYICGMVVAGIILFMGYELIKSSINKILNPSIPELQWLGIIILLLSVLFKIWLAVFNRHIGKQINSSAVNAVVADSISDVVATVISVLAVILSFYLNKPLDGYFGIVVSCFVIYAGYGVLKETVAPLIGTPPSANTIKDIEDRILSYNNIVGVHDLIVHDYGPGKRFVTAHAEIPSSLDMMVGHDIIDIIERDLNKELGYSFTLHMDPVETDNEQVVNTSAIVEAVVKSIDHRMSIHDFRMVSGPKHTNLIFDVVVPYSLKKSCDEIVSEISLAMKEVDNSSKQ